jgi:hypothetical protein
VESDGEFTHLDVSHATSPIVSQTWAISLARSAYSTLVARLGGPQGPPEMAQTAESRASTEPLEMDDGASSTATEQSDMDGKGARKNTGTGAEMARSSGRKKKAARKRG